MKEEAAMTIVDIEVTPLLVQDNAAICEIKPGQGAQGKVIGGVIRLEGGGPFNLRFTITSSEAGDLKFLGKGDDAFWCNTRACPPNKMHASKNQLGSATVSADGKTLEIEAKPTGKRNAVHYSLGFNDGSRFDPIIIHDFPKL